ncbi:aromatic ring-hydroxylating dioxygenase subunit alpha [Mycobacterium sp. CVI_P3]|uniref:Aromatic ring-hydroxylating dioxygenase subunit alpha n=1 Tax=Mycobacterium pinniadriaticum TaxID=2994102 RepID=A0ABT3SLZ7_9MYCO|nr:aromatic ring-hydroxylating dioxygenase subunit alpha [Mycobacterium pinniadriaticum]MCX2933742.1 aromatic ring-hydroxylating dioxygenase subunit alpha [Mycobacterium pinniadriaticum]MCX2940164.1 aromatic ring-hydroxylating dioxygenase subunit alpha [Mycobacterium pinniadriaticum]
MSIADIGVSDSTDRVRDWVRPDEGKILGRVYVDPDVHRDEIERIWKKSWLYAGHESEVPEPGDYLTRTVGTVPLIISRTTDGEVAVIVNRCMHRGNLVCYESCGNTQVFQCDYHGWSYRNSGELVGVPYQQSYGPDFDKSRHGMQPPARVSIYRGLIFISYAPEGPGLEEHLGNAREVLDRYLDLSPTGRLRLDAGYNRIRLDCNWKMYAENSSDNYHNNFVHVSAYMTDAARKIARAISREGSKGVVWALGNGHSYLDFRAEEQVQGMVLRSASASADDDSERQYVRDLEARIGADRAATLLSEGPPTLFIFPNLFVIQQDMRRLEPVSETTSHLYQHPTLFDGAPDAINRQRLTRHETAYGPAGFVMSDDLEVFAQCQRAINETPDEWILLTRGMRREEQLENGTRRAHVTDETGMRGMWREYLRLMSREQL